LWPLSLNFAAFRVSGGCPFRAFTRGTDDGRTRRIADVACLRFPESGDIAYAPALGPVLPAGDIGRSSSGGVRGCRDGRDAAPGGSHPARLVLVAHARRHTARRDAGAVGGCRYAPAPVLVRLHALVVAGRGSGRLLLDGPRVRRALPGIPPGAAGDGPCGVLCRHARFCPADRPAPAARKQSGALSFLRIPVRPPTDSRQGPFAFLDPFFP